MVTALVMKVEEISACISPRSSIDRVTLRRWCRRASIQPHQDPSNLPRRYLTSDEIPHLARLHNRVLMVDTDAVQLSQIERLEARIAELERRDT